MRIQALTYKRVQNLGNYSSETLEATAIVDEDEDPFEVSKTLRQFVLSELNLLKGEEEDEAAVDAMIF